MTVLKTTKILNTGPANTVAEIPKVSPYAIVGAPGLKQYAGVVREEFLRELIGRKGMATFREMRENDPTIGAIMYLFESFLSAADWRVEGATASAEDQDAADFVQENLANLTWDTFEDTLSDIITFMTFGFSVHEKIYRREGNILMWAGFPIRAQETLFKWVFDENQRAQAMVQQIPSMALITTIPLNKCLHFRTSVHKSNPEGRSLLRNCYRPWFMKTRIENIEAMGVERDLTGVPIGRVPASSLAPGATGDDSLLQNAMRDVVTRTKRDEQEGFLLPSDRDPVTGEFIVDLQLLSTGGRRQFDTSQIINRYDQRILMSLLADFLMLGQGPAGSWALAASKTEVWSFALRRLMGVIASVFNRQAIPELLELNGMTGKAVLVHGDVETQDLSVLGDYVQKLTGSGMPMFPDPALEQWLRDQASMPAMSEETSRAAEAGAEPEGDKVDGDGPSPEDIDDEDDAEDAERAADEQRRDMQKRERIIKKRVPFRRHVHRGNNR